MERLNDVILVQNLYVEVRQLVKEVNTMDVEVHKLKGSISAIYELIKDLQIKVEFLETKL